MNTIKDFLKKQVANASLEEVLDEISAAANEIEKETKKKSGANLRPQLEAVYADRATIGDGIDILSAILSNNYNVSIDDETIADIKKAAEALINYVTELKKIKDDEELSEMEKIGKMFDTLGKMAELKVGSNQSSKEKDNADLDVITKFITSL